MTGFAPCPDYTYVGVRDVEPVTVYIDILFLVNLTVDYFLLRSVAEVRRLVFRRLRLLLGAAVGAVYSCLVFFPALSIGYTLVGKLLASAAVTFAAFGARSKKSYLRTFLLFHAASALFAGLTFALELTLSPQKLVWSNGEVYIDLSAGMLIACAAAAYGVLWLCSRLGGTKRETYVPLTVAAGGKEITAVALCDTGNLLCDPLTGASVAVVGFRTVLPLFPADVAAAFMKNDLSAIENGGWRTRVCFVPCSTVTGGGLLPAFRPDRVLINGKDTEKKILIAVSPEEFGEEYNAVCGAIAE